MADQTGRNSAAEEPVTVKSPAAINWVTWIAVLAALVIITIGILFISGFFSTINTDANSNKITSEERAKP